MAISLGSGGGSKPPTSTGDKGCVFKPNADTRKGKPPIIGTKITNPNDFSYQNNLDKYNKSTNPVKTFMKLCPPKRTFNNDGSAAYNEAMKNYFGSYPEDMMRNLDNQLSSLAFWASSASVVLATVASMSNYAAYVLWWVPGWGQVLTTTALVTSVLAVGTGFTGVGLDGN